MIVCKFGGTSVGDAAAIRRLIAIVTGRQAERPMLVLSALARVTDGLLALEGISAANAARRLDAIVTRHAELAAELGIEPVASIAADAAALRDRIAEWVGRDWTDAERDQVASHGELWSTRLVTAALAGAGLPAVWVDARTLVATDGNHGQAAPDQAEITRRARAEVPGLLAAGSIPVTQGFIAAGPDGATTTLGRGGSDYTASLLGAALGADRVEIWTDVDGILSADPRIVPEARLLPEASYLEAAELAAFGAKVLHPATQLPLIAARIPCLVLNSFAPERPGTRIVAEARPGLLVTGSPVRSIAWKRGITVVNVRAPRAYGAVGFLHQLFGVFARHGVSVDVLASTEVNVSVTLDDGTDLPSLVRDLEPLGAVSIFEGRAIVAVIGLDLRGTRGLSARLFGAVRDVNIEMISQGASEINVTFVVREEDGPGAVRALHREFFAA
ncbi:MAG: aspartate kinase [Gemmatimonadales bacterium]